MNYKVMECRYNYSPGDADHYLRLMNGKQSSKRLKISIKFLN